MSLLSYHAVLINDETRTQLFINALTKQIKPGSRVLDIGTGSGVLAVAAAKMGAIVTAVERTEMIEFAKELAEENNVSCKIKFIQKDIAEISTEEIEPCDIVVSEMLGNILLDEALITVMKSGRRFLKPGGILIPESANFKASLAWSPIVENAVNFWRQNRFDIDFSVFCKCIDNTFHPETTKNTILLGGHQSFSSINLYSASNELFDEEVILKADKDAKCNAVLVWWDSVLTDGIILSLDPLLEWKNQHWYRTLFPIPETNIISDEKYPFRLSYDGTHPIQNWSWKFGSTVRSSFFSVPPSRARLKQLME